jgi:hypothetical protein
VPCDITAWYFYCFHCIFDVVESCKTKQKQESISMMMLEKTSVQGILFIQPISSSTGDSYVAALLSHFSFASSV